MTTPRPEDFISIATIKDRESLTLVGRMLESQRLTLEAQLSQTRQLQEAVNTRIQSIK
jgi:hypothetical protein